MIEQVERSVRLVEEARIFRRRPDPEEHAGRSARSSDAVDQIGLEVDRDVIALDGAGVVAVAARIASRAAGEGIGSIDIDQIRIEGRTVEIIDEEIGRM